MLHFQKLIFLLHVPNFVFSTRPCAQIAPFAPFSSPVGAECIREESESARVCTQVGTGRVALLWPQWGLAPGVPRSVTSIRMRSTRSRSVAPVSNPALSARCSSFSTARARTARARTRAASGMHASSALSAFWIPACVTQHVHQLIC